MRKVAAILLVFVVLLQCSTKIAVVAWYQLNKEFIAANLCENKAKPKMKCEGKCQMKKKIRQQERSESKLPLLIKQFSEVSWFFTEKYFAWQPFTIKQIVANSTSPYRFSYLTTFQGSIFQPPKL